MNSGFWLKHLEGWIPSPTFPPPQTEKAGGEAQRSVLSTIRGPGGHLVRHVQKGGLAWRFKFQVVQKAMELNERACGGR